MAFELGSRRGETIDIPAATPPAPASLATDERRHFEELDLL